jgi:hypothetical protein
VILAGLFFYSCENTIIDRSTVNTIYGCTDYNACNYDGSANANDGSCNYYDVCNVCAGDGSTCINYGVVINEINYNSSVNFDPEDWVELYNSNNSPINIGNWKLKDEENLHVFTIPENTILSAGDFLVLCKDTIAFTTLFPEVNNVIGDFEFGLNNSGEIVRLFDSSELLVDKVEYDDEDPWPTEPDNTGPTLELINPSLANDMASNWVASIGNGTPGEINSVYNDE